MGLDTFRDALVASYGGGERKLEENIAIPDRLEVAIRTQLAERWSFEPSATLTHDALVSIALDNQYNPLLEYLDEAQAKWDQKTRIDTWLIDYCGAEDTPLNRPIGRMHLIASVRRVRQPGCKYDYILTMESPEGKNKSSAIALLASRAYFSDQSILTASDKEVQELVGGVWLYEIADVTGVTKAEVNKVKAFASRTTDRARPAYGRNRQDRERRCTFWATTNDSQYLLSQTGNRRFLPVAVGRIDLEALARDRDMLWAEAAAAEATGESIFLPEELWGAAADEQDERRLVDPWEDALARMPQTVMIWDKQAGTDAPLQVVHRTKEIWPPQLRVRSQTVLEHVLGIARAQQNQGHGKRLATVMERLGWQRPSGKACTLKIDGDSVRGYWRLAPDAPAQGEMAVEPGGVGQ